MNTLTLTFLATECSGWPKLRFFIDDDLYEDYEFTSDSARIDIPLDLLDGNHTLSVELYGKTYQNTKVENNVIVADQLVTLEDIFIDDIKVPDLIKYSGKYIETPSVLTWGINGCWKLVFEHPIITWVLKCKQYATTVSQDDFLTELYTDEKERQTRAQLEFVEQLLKNV